MALWETTVLNIELLKLLNELGSSPRTKGVLVGSEETQDAGD